MTGRVVHFELPYDDADRANRFYKEAFNWSFQPIPEMDYTLVATTESGESGPITPGAINGGLLARSDLFQGPLITVEVDDIEASLLTIERLGGQRVVGSQPVGDMGFSGYCRDTEGNLIGLWQSA